MEPKDKFPKFYSVNICNVLFELGLHAKDFFVYAFLKRMADEEEQMTIPQMAKKLRMGETTFRLCLKTLKRRQYVRLHSGKLKEIYLISVKDSDIKINDL